MTAEGAAGLDRFVAAQAHSFDTALAELRSGRKASHWMWFIFPQLRGLGTSGMAIRYGIADAAEAADYLAHPLLGPRLVRCARAVLGHRELTADEIMGAIDALKLRSSMTLFEAVPGADPVFAEVLDGFYGGQRCPRTRAMLAG